LGDLHVSRPRINFPIGGRYTAAAASVGSKVFIYGGLAVPTSKNIPIIQGQDAPELNILMNLDGNVDEKSEFENQNDGQVQQAIVRNRMEEDEGIEAEENDLELDNQNDVLEGDALQRQFDDHLEMAFERYYHRIARQAEQAGRQAPVPEEVMQQFVAALMAGEIDLRGILPQLDADENDDENDDDSDGSDDSDDSDDVTPINVSDKHMNLSNPSNDIDSSKNDVDSSSNPISNDGDDNSDSNSDSDSDGDDDDDFSLDDPYFSSQRTSTDYDTYVMDLDACDMKHIFPNPQMQPNLAKITLNKEKKGKWMFIDDDGLGGCAITPPQDASFPPCLAVASKSFNVDRCGSFGYFELQVINPGPRRLLTLGLLPPKYPVEGKQPGWNAGSFGLHGDDGAIFCQAGSGDPFADRFEPNDVIGCGVYWPTKEVFFSINGRFLGFAPSKVTTRRLYACVGIRNEDAKYRINFGSEPFRFDFRAPTLEWNKIKLFQNPSTQSKQSFLPRVTVPQFAHEPSEKHLILYSIDPITWKDAYIFSIEKMAYSKRILKGSFPSKMQQSKHQSTQISILNMEGFGLGKSKESSPLSNRFVFHFNPRSKDRSPILALFDTFLLEWYDIGGAHDAFAASSLPQAEFALQWLELITALDNDDYATCWMIEIGSQLVWTCKNSFIVADPINAMFSQQPLTSKSVSLSTQGTKLGMKLMNANGSEGNGGNEFSSSAYSAAAVCFAGWDGANQLNDIAIFKVNEGGWYAPTYSGVVPRPRNAHNGVVVMTRSSYFGANASDLPNGLKLNEARPVIVNAFGWSGRQVMNDIDIFSFSTSPSDLALNTSILHDLDIHVKSIDPSEIQVMKAHKIVLFCRSSKFRQLLDSNDAIHVETQSLDSFKGMLHFFYTDQISREPTWLTKHGRNLALLIDIWAPELAPKLLERLLLTRTTLPDLFPSQLLLGFNNPIFSDLTLEVSIPTESESMPSQLIQIPVHKIIIISRSPYFKAMCTGGMAESSQKVIRIQSEVPIEAFKLVIEFLYTYEVPYDRCSEHIVDMFVLACRFQVLKLKSTLENLLIFNLSAENVAGLLIVAHTQSSHGLLNECINFIQTHQKEVQMQPEYLAIKSQIEDILASKSRTSS
jgi:hypothetical protein